MTDVLMDFMTSKKAVVPLVIAHTEIIAMKKPVTVFVLPTPLESNVTSVRQITGDIALSLDARLVTVVVQDLCVQTVIRLRVAVSAG